ncbi:MAG: S8 family serine peptidase, partial [Phenylobacterium sp.]
MEELYDLVVSAIKDAFGQRRLLQQSPILPDVWAAFVNPNLPRSYRRFDEDERTERRIDVLLTPGRASSSGAVARALRQGLVWLNDTTADPAATPIGAAQLVANVTLVAAKLTFKELVCAAAPLTEWWNRLPEQYRNNARIHEAMGPPPPGSDPRLLRNTFDEEFFTFACTCGLIETWLTTAMTEADLRAIAERLRNARRLEPEFDDLLNKYLGLWTSFEHPVDRDVAGALVARIQLNRVGTLSVAVSRQTIKADACENLFKTSTLNITWGVLDCGVDARHPCFMDGPAPPSGDFVSRVTRTYDFTGLRDMLGGMVQLDASGNPLNPVTIAALASRVEEGLPIDLALLEGLLRVPHGARYIEPMLDHGTHVAGIIGASRTICADGIEVQGICPDIRLWDIRVFNSNNESDEFSIVTALQFIAHMNRSTGAPMVHGLNLSFSFAHDVGNYACGRTPICLECDRLVDNGVVVVVAAGNAGYSDDGSTPSLNDRYAVVSITDPGNAANVITVGSTHRSQPHAYGVSFFSSRGPTGDGRLKPDLVAPGENIVAPSLGGRTAEKDGTSMA